MSDETKSLPALLADLKENATIDTVRRLLAQNVNPMSIIDECQTGIVEVGKRYERGEYYISGLIMAGEIMRQVSDLVLPALQNRFTGHVNGRVLLATVQGDIHYIGKNIFKILLQCFGFTVADAGEDVSPEEILQQVREFSPHVIGLSCLVTAAYDSMRDTISLLRNSASPVPRIIVGGMVDEKVYRYVGADTWSNDAMSGVRICQEYLKSVTGLPLNPPRNPTDD